MATTRVAWQRRTSRATEVLACSVIALLGAPRFVFAQWLRYPTTDVSRTADGKPNLNAPAPRLPDGKPDFSGIWGTAVHNGCRAEIAQFIPCGSELPGSPLAIDLAAGVPGGPPYQPWAAALVKQRTADLHKDDPHARCLPDNPPRPYALPHLTKAVHRPRLLVLLNEVNAMYRQILIDGRPLPVDPNPTVDDAKAYTRPWTVSMPMEIRLDTELVDEFCLENEKSSQHMQVGK